MGLDSFYETGQRDSDSVEVRALNAESAPRHGRKRVRILLTRGWRAFQ